MKSNSTITVNNISEVCDCIKNVLDKENHMSIDVRDVEPAERTKIRMFLEGVAYANDTILQVNEDICSITIDESCTFINCKYSLKMSETYEYSVINKNDLNLAVDALAEGKTIIIDLSKADEDAAAYFHYLCGAAFSLCGNLDRVNEDTFKFTPRLIKLPENQNDLKQINIIMNEIHDLIESDNASFKAERVESLYQECVGLLDKYEYLTPVRMYYSDYLCSIGNYDAAIEELDTFCDLYLNGDAKCNSLFQKVVSKDFQLHLKRGGFEELNSFASKLIEQCTSYEKSSNTVLGILNAQTEILIESKNSRNAIKIFRSNPLDTTNCDLNSQLNYLFLKALALYKIGRFGKSQRVIADMLSMIESDDCSTMNYIGAKRLQATIYAQRGRTMKAIGIYEALINKVYLKNSVEYKIPYANDAASIAGIYLDNKNYDKAKEWYHTAIEYCEEKRNIAIYYHNLGVCYYKQEKYKDAKACFLSSVTQKMELINDDPLYDSYDGLIASIEYLQDISRQRANI